MRYAVRRMTIPAAMLLAGSGCLSLDLGGQGITREHVDSAIRVGSAFAQANERLDDVQEYYVGRAVAARILSRFTVCADEAMQAYVNRVGHTVALHSDRPRTYGGYRFAVLEAPEPNAFAAPGGFVFVTSTLVRQLVSEDQLAGVLAHEVAHVSAKHGLAAIRSARFRGAVGTAILEGAQTFGDADAREAAGVLQGAVGDILETILERGYGREQEMEADERGTVFAYRAGYDPAGLSQFLESMHGAPPGGWTSSHPGADRRLVASREQVATHGMKGITAPVRTLRFRQFVPAQ